MKSLNVYALTALMLCFSLFTSFAQEESEGKESSGTESVENELITCGTERWAVKTCYDADTVNVNFNNIVPSSVAYQISLTHPTLPGDNTTRLPSEDTVYSIDCLITKIKFESSGDQDYHVVIADLSDTTKTMVAEIPNHACPNIINTSRYNQIKTLREWFTAQFNPTSSFKYVGQKVHLTGVGFFDFPHGQTGAALNQREIHPILTMQLLSNVPVEFTTFSGTADNGSVNLKWQTATEINNSGFDVERKQGNSEWSKIAFVKGTGNSTSIVNYSFSDKTATGGKYCYRLKQTDYDGKFVYSDQIEVDLGLPKNYVLAQNFPNPFNPSTVISYSLPDAANVTLTVFNSLGQTVKVVENGFKSAGNHEATFDAKEFSSGVYFYKLEAGNFTDIKKMMLIK